MKEKQQHAVVNLYSPWDRLNAGLHFAGAAGLVAAAAVVVSPKVVAVSAVLSALHVVLAKKVHLGNPGFVPHGRGLDFAPQIHDVMQELSQKTGRKKTVPPCDFRVVQSCGHTSVWQEACAVMARRMETSRDQVRAVSTGLGKANVLISPALLKITDNKEQKAILAHEMVHVGARHSGLHCLLRALTRTVTYATVWNVAQAVLTPESLLSRSLVWLGFATAGAGICGSYSRSMEFHADRGSVLLGADPLALITSLRRTTKAVTGSDTVYGRTGFVGQLWASYPDTGRRLDRLRGMAEAAGQASREIDRALSGTLPRRQSCRDGAATGKKSRKALRR
jgi:hypothetical protein